MDQKLIHVVFAEEDTLGAGADDAVFCGPDLRTLVITSLRMRGVR